MFKKNDYEQIAKSKYTIPSTVLYMEFYGFNVDPRNGDSAFRQKIQEGISKQTSGFIKLNDNLKEYSLTI